MGIRKFRIALLRLSAVPLILLAVFVDPSWNPEPMMSFGLEFVGYVFLLAGLLIRAWSTLYIGGLKSRTLVTEGPYSLCRNPLYVGTFLLAVGVGLCFENLAMLIAVLVLFMPLHLVVVRSEEAHLESLFPTEYAAYKTHVSRFWPRFANYHTRDELSVSVRAIRRVMIDTIAVLMIPYLEDLLEILHDTGIIPVFWHFP